MLSEHSIDKHLFVYQDPSVVLAELSASMVPYLVSVSMDCEVSLVTITRASYDLSCWTLVLKQCEEDPELVRHNLTLTDRD